MLVENIVQHIESEPGYVAEDAQKVTVYFRTSF